MRRFSQRNSLVTLNEINITPLLDLAFVLLIIFVITRPLLEQSMDMNLPQLGSQQNQDKILPKDVETVEINAKGQMRLNGTPKQTVAQIEADLVKAYHANPRIVVNIRADKNAPWDNVAAIFNACLKNGITRVAPQTAPVK
jgi:biopolymer transport protein ExbD/biopolymer transport protein TolR